MNGVRLFVDVANPGLVPDGAVMRGKPTLLMLHGGPGFDHVGFKTALSSLGDVAQVIFYDHRGNGRSEGGDTSAWNLRQWGDDVKGLCDALGLINGVPPPPLAALARPWSVSSQPSRREPITA